MSERNNESSALEKQRIRCEIEDQVKSFLESGGTIQTLQQPGGKYRAVGANSIEQDDPRHLIDS